MKPRRLYWPYLWFVCTIPVPVYVVATQLYWIDRFSAVFVFPSFGIFFLLILASIFGRARYLFFTAEGLAKLQWRVFGGALVGSCFAGILGPPSVIFPFSDVGDVGEQLFIGWLVFAIAFASVVPLFIFVFIEEMMDMGDDEPYFSKDFFFTWQAHACLTISLFTFTFSLHMFFGLPALSGTVAASVYFFVGAAVASYLCILIKSSTAIRPSHIIGICAVYSLIPIVLTGIVGYINFQLLDHTNGPDRSPAAHPVDWFKENRMASPLILFVSDTHFIGDKKKGRTFEGGLWKAEAITALKEATINLTPRYLLIAGDMTDTGAKEEWKKAADFLSEIRSEIKNNISIILVPGTHDLQPAYRGVSHNEARTELKIAGGVLAERVLNIQGSFQPEIQWFTVSKRLSEQEIAKQIEADYEDCENGCNTHFYAGDEAATGAVACSSNCKATKKRQLTREEIPTGLARHFAPFCMDWHPVVHHDVSNSLSIVVLCSAGEPTWKVGDSAIGSLGEGQIRRLAIILNQLPVSSSRVLIVLHHPPLRRIDDKLGLPEHLFSKHDWEESLLWRYAFLNNNRRESSNLVKVLLDVARGQPDKEFYLMYGHGHTRYLSAVSDDKGTVIDVVEAPAIAEGKEMWLGYSLPNSHKLSWEIIQKPAGLN